MFRARQRPSVSVVFAFDLNEVLNSRSVKSFYHQFTPADSNSESCDGQRLLRSCSGLEKCCTATEYKNSNSF